MWLQGPRRQVQTTKVARMFHDALFAGNPDLIDMTRCMTDTAASPFVLKFVYLDMLHELEVTLRARRLNLNGANHILLRRRWLIVEPVDDRDIYLSIQSHIFSSTSHNNQQWRRPSPSRHCGLDSHSKPAASSPKMPSSAADASISRRRRTSASLRQNDHRS